MEYSCTIFYSRKKSGVNNKEYSFLLLYRDFLLGELRDFKIVTKHIMPNSMQITNGNMPEILKREWYNKHDFWLNIYGVVQIISCWYLYQIFYSKIVSMWFCNVIVSHSSTPYGILGEMFKLLSIHLMQNIRIPYLQHSLVLLLLNSVHLLVPFGQGSLQE